MGVQPDRGCAPLGGAAGMGAISMTGIPVGVGASEMVVNELATDGEQGVALRPQRARPVRCQGNSTWRHSSTAMLGGPQAA